MGESAQKRSFDSISKDWALLVVAVCVVPVYFLVAHFADDGRALVASCSAGMIAVIVRYFWDLRKHMWFWAAITFIVVLHVSIVLFLPPPAKRWNYVHWNYVQMLPFGLLDFGIAFGIIRLLESVAKKAHSK
jgi:hypothetical protein